MAFAGPGSLRLTAFPPNVLLAPGNALAESCAKTGDGIFDKLSSEEAINVVWKTEKSSKTVHQFVGAGIESIMKEALMRRSYDNVTVVIIGLKNLDTLFNNKRSDYYA